MQAEPNDRRAAASFAWLALAAACLSVLAVAAWLDARQSGAVEPETMAITGLRLSRAEVSLEAAAALLPARTGRQMALFLRDQSARESLETRLKHLNRLDRVLAELADELGQVGGGERRSAQESSSATL